MRPRTDTQTDRHTDVRDHNTFLVVFNSCEMLTSNKWTWETTANKRAEGDWTQLVIIIIIQHLYSALKSCKGYGAAGVNVWSNASWMWDKQCIQIQYQWSKLEYWLTELRFYVPLDTKQVISETFFIANLLAWYGKTEPWHNKSMHSPIKRNVAQHEINPKSKARFSRLLRYPAWKQRGPILVSALHKFVSYSLT